MPQNPKRPCNRCKKLTDKPFCLECQKLMLTKYDSNRETALARGYDSRWRKVRIIKLRRNPLCERCLQQDKTTRAVLVHHKDRNTRNLLDDNLESLCRPCHDVEHLQDFNWKKVSNG